MTFAARPEGQKPTAPFKSPPSVNGSGAGGTYVELVLIRGLPGSGKSTIARAMTGYVHCESDDYFFKDGAYKFDKQKLSEAHRACYEDARGALQAGLPVVVANTFTRKWEANVYFELARRLGVPVRVLVANGDYKNVHGVPEPAIAKMRERWEEF